MRRYIIRNITYKQILLSYEDPNKVISVKKSPTIDRTHPMYEIISRDRLESGDVSLASGS